MVKKKDEETQVAQDEQPVIVEGSESDTHTENPDIANTEIVNDDNSIATGTVTSEVKTTSTTVVIPFFKAIHSLDALICSVRLALQNLKDINIVVIGDDPEVLKEEISVIPLTIEGDNQPLMMLLSMAIDSDLVSDQFILMEHNTFIIDSIDLSHIALPKHIGHLIPNRYSGKLADIVTRTRDFILNECKGIPSYNYITHCPVMLNKTLLVDMFEECTQLASGEYDIISVYMNAYAKHPIELDYTKDRWILPIVSDKPDKKTVDRLISGKCFVYIKNPDLIDFVTPFIDKIE